MIGSLLHLRTWSVYRRASPSAKTVRTERPDGGIGADAPIQTASEDRLRRGDFANRIAGVLSERSLHEGRVFAIRGEWGFGKSSLKNLITEQLDARSDGADWLDFNPWQWGNADAISRALFGQIADLLGSKHSDKAFARAEALRHYGAILTGVGAPLKAAGGSNSLISAVLTNASVIAIASAIGFDLPTAAKVATVLAILSVGTPLLGRVLSYFGHDRSGEPLDKVRKELEVHLRELDRPLVAFIDDIDRLEPEQIRMLLRQIKANANLPNIVFVLLFQPSIVERALDPVANGDGRAFLEKIVQASFDLPAVPVSIVHRIFEEELSELAGLHAIEANGFSRTRWGNTFVGCIQPMLRNMRDARRLISSIAIHMPLHMAGDMFEVNIVDFLLLETLRVFEPGLHAALFRERDLVLQEQRLSGYSSMDADRAAAERLLEIVSKERRAIIQDALKDLFPPLEWAYGGTSYADGFHSGWLTTKRVCTARYFPRYFELQTPAGEISEHRFATFINATATKEGLAAAIADLQADDLLPSLVARLDESVDQLPVENAAVLLPGLFLIAQKLVGLRDLNPFNSPWLSAWRATSWFLKRIPENERGDLAFEALRQTEALSIAAILIHLSDPADRQEDDEDDFESALHLGTVEAMKGEWLRLMRSRAADGDTLISEPDLVPLLYRWGKYAGSLDAPREWMMKTVKTDKGFAAIVTRMMGRVASHSSGDRVSTSHNKFDKSTIEDFIGIELAKTRCDAINPTEFPEHEEALRTLHISLEMWLGLRGRDPLDF
ncbi:KAP family NTPase [Massilia sp. MB5]|uniref:KAP family P-loop NTPase fold protein n=1 Tax=Massilia sp. MB5 TaxID=2919578 RepID=UPI001F0ED6FE|nr:P-loop NTPase fold protein [Massilia sp. MB5]UMR29221.1 KAP family NTPase [Massilia sp. MB5]